MSNEQWRTDTNAGDYFLHQQKQLQVADRRPVIRKASDLVGPGINANTTVITDYNDLLATFNGYYSSEPGAASAPNETEAFVGSVISDSVLGGRQEFTGLTSGAVYTRTFQRSPIDPEALAWGAWTERRRTPATYDAQAERDTPVLSGSAASLFAPDPTSMAGDQSVFSRSDGSLALRRQGVYTGVAQVGDRAGSTVATVSFWRPQGNTTLATTHLSVPLAPTFYIPFTVVATDEYQAFYMSVQHAAGATRAIWWRLSVTRIGDAV